uniref:Neurotransmitter-gated ion-channel ligand-binding domain-containing protein n=1 Tax=Haptolina brevifila TaxID=156173 RepID=A0A7S2J9A2_9EUKA|mmetsp:Transcript_78627/g.156296  ORF Transcript_78627/g.156296 Transcript_78627/m.156296 type:complete len:448 (+) Transcript_78627:105-1448(+)
MLSIISTLASASTAANSTWSQLAIMERLLSNYDRTMRPGHTALDRGSEMISSTATVQDALSCIPPGHPDLVIIRPIVHHVHSIDQVGKTFKVQGTVTIYWDDWRLNYSALSCLDEVTLGSLRDTGGIWEPGVVTFESQQARYGGAHGALALLGEAVSIKRSGHVTWTRRFESTFGCPGMSYGQMPFDAQGCLITFGSFPYSAADVSVIFSEITKHAAAAISFSTGEWMVTVASVREVTVSDKSYARLCFKLERSSNNAEFSIIMSILFVCAAYAGFYVSPAAAPARIALAFLCFLMVLNNVTTLYARLPPLKSAQKGRVWISDFLFGCMIFNFVSLIQYAAVNYGITCRAAKKAALAAAKEAKEAQEEPPVNTSTVQIEVSPTDSHSQHRRLRPAWYKKWDPSVLADLDIVFRWLFPIAFIIFISIMFGTISIYPPGSTCDFEARPD